MARLPRLSRTPGRSLNQCRVAFDEMRRTIPPQHSLMSGPYGPQTPLSAPPGGVLKRPFTLEAPYAAREIRPKPFPPSGSSLQASTSEPPTKRKRGRPTKAAAQAKAAAEAEATARSDPGPAPPQLQSSPQITAPAAITGPVEVKPAVPATSRMPISAVLTPNAPKTASSSSSSSGKRRRGRSTRSEPEGFGLAESSGSAQEYESPYARAIGAPEDTPARTAVLRHREEMAASQQPPGPEHTEPGPELR